MRPSNISLANILKAIADADTDAMPMIGAIEDVDVIHSYSRAQAIEDGVLVDVSKTATELGIVFPTALTSSAWVDAVAMPPGADWDTEAIRLRVLLERTICELNNSDERDVRFFLYVPDGPGEGNIVELRALLAPGDDLQPVITLMLASED